MAQLGKSVKGKGKDKKKKAKTKTSSQTSAEKALEDKIKRLRENDFLKRLAQATKARLYEAMEQESSNSKMNTVRIQNQWRKIMRLAKVESLRKEIEILSQIHERDIDRKDAVIQMLDQDLEESEEQYQMALRSHLQNVDNLINLQDSKLLQLENEFENDLSILTDEFNIEREEIIKQHAMEKQELLDIMAAVEAEEQDREAEAKQEHEQIREEIRNKNLEDINILRITLEQTIEELEKHFESAHLNYLQNTDQRTQDFKYLTRKDQDLSKEIEVKIRKIERLQASLAHWRTKINQNTKECEERNEALQQEKDQISQHFQQLKSRMNKFRDRQSKRLSDLTKNVAASKDDLNSNLKVVESILSVAELCRKVETEAEKVLPFYQEVIADAAAEAEDVVKKPSDTGNGSGPLIEAKDDELHLSLEHANDQLKACALDKDGKVINTWDYLNNFYKKVNKVTLDKIAIEKEKERLEKENRDLQLVLKQYLDGVSVNEEIMNSINPLLVVNGRVNLNRTVPINARAAPTVIEGNHMISTMRTF